MSIQGVRYQVDPTYDCALCIIDDFSLEMEQILRTELTKVCHGQAKANSTRVAYSYKRTLQELIKRYQSKTEKTKIGMIGELLCHLLLFRLNGELASVSPMFNMEEASIKKGFDLLVSHKISKDLWITEVKSGALGKIDKDQKIRTLIDKARDDLLERIGAENSTIWHTAINNVTIALENSRPEKAVLVDLLEDFLDQAEDGTNDPSTMSVILVPILFESTANEANFDIIKERNKKILEDKLFSNCIIFAIQKSTVAKVESFLYNEAK